MAEASPYEFDAPSHAVDFMELVNAETDDGWFGMFPHNEPCRPVFPLETI